MKFFRVGETGVGEMGQIIGKMAVCKIGVIKKKCLQNLLQQTWTTLNQAIHGPPVTSGGSKNSKIMSCSMLFVTGNSWNCQCQN